MHELTQAGRVFGLRFTPAQLGRVMRGEPRITKERFAEIVSSTPVSAPRSVPYALRGMCLGQLEHLEDVFVTSGWLDAQCSTFNYANSSAIASGELYQLLPNLYALERLLGVIWKVLACSATFLRKARQAWSWCVSGSQGMWLPQCPSLVTARHDPRIARGRCPKQDGRRLFPSCSMPMASSSIVLCRISGATSSATSLPVISSSSIQLPNLHPSTATLLIRKAKRSQRCVRGPTCVTLDCKWDSRKQWCSGFAFLL